MEVPETLSMMIGVPLSIISSAELVPVIDLMGMLKVVPVKEKMMPVPLQVSSLVTGLTGPRYVNVAAEPL